MKKSLSLCMIVKDEEKTLERCLKSAETFIDEIIIVDTGSTDNTKEIAKKFNAKIYDFEWIQDFAAARNYAFSKATKDYILWLDGDDYIKEESIKIIEDILNDLDKSIDYISAEYILGRNEKEEVTYSLVRNRIVRRSMNYQWIGKVHEYLLVYGNGISGEFSIEHGKVKGYTNRNLQIFRKMEQDKEVFTPRDLLYYANELRDNVCYKEAIEKYTQFLDTKQGWIEDIKTAYAKIAECYKLLGEINKIPDVIFESFKHDTPRADICCTLGEYYMEGNMFNQAAFWYRVALDCRPEKGSLAIDCKEYYTWIPSLQLCVCYFYMENLNCAYFFNELAATFGGSLEKIEYNRKFFKGEFERIGREFPEIKYPISIADYINYI